MDRDILILLLNQLKELGVITSFSVHSTQITIVIKKIAADNWELGDYFK